MATSTKGGGGRQLLQCDAYFVGLRKPRLQHVALSGACWCGLAIFVCAPAFATDGDLSCEPWAKSRRLQYFRSARQKNESEVNTLLQVWYYVSNSCNPKLPLVVSMVFWRAF